ncbi:MAG: radical SAM protein [Pseudomonadota bacterium]
MKRAAVGLAKSELAYSPANFGPLVLVVLQGTPFCNLNCSYCYLPEDSRRRTDQMAPEELRKIARNIFASSFIENEVQFSWHAGEPMVLKPDYYRACVEEVVAARDDVLGPDVEVTFDMQTNATLVTDEWCAFIKEMGDAFSLGVSCDGPKELHDAHRKNWNGRATHAQTEAGLRKFCEHGIAFDVTSVVSLETLKHPEAFIEYFAKFNHNIKEFHYNLYDDLSLEGSEDEAAYVELYGEFLKRLLAYAASPKGERIPKIRNFTSFYNRILIDEVSRPDYAADAMAQPFKTLSVESNGDATTLYAGLTQDESRDVRDLYGDGKGFCVGNLLETPLDEIAYSEKVQRVIADFDASHKACAGSCDYFDVCSGGYNLIKFRRAGRFDISETPECRIHVQTFADTVLDDIQRNIQR